MTLLPALGADHAAHAVVRRVIVYGLGDDAVEDFRAKAPGWGLKPTEMEMCIRWHEDCQRMRAGERFAPPSPEPTMSPCDAKAQIQKLMNDRRYWDAEHVEQRMVVAEVARLHRQVYRE